jgi:hypothetical protein
MRFSIVLDCTKFQPGADVCFCSACFIYPQEPDVNVEAAAADEARKMF